MRRALGCFAFAALLFGKKFGYKIYQDAPGGHTFNRIDTRLARESRQEIYAFLARYLKPAGR